MPWPRLTSEARRDALLRKQIVALLPRLRRFARSLAGSVDAADDLVQMACERALKRLGQYRSGTRLDSWIYRIVYTQWIDQVRRRKRRAGQTDALQAMNEVHRLEEYPSRQIAAYLDVKKALDHLPEEQRAAIVLVAVEGYTYAEASSVLGIPAGTVASRVARARIDLIERFRDNRPRRFKIYKGTAGRKTS